MTILRNRVKSSDNPFPYTTALPVELVSGSPGSRAGPSAFDGFATSNGPALTLMNDDDFCSEESQPKLEHQFRPYPQGKEELWVEKATGRQFNGPTAKTLIGQGQLSWDDLEHVQIQKGASVSEPIDPISGVLVATYGTVREVTGGIADYPVYVYRTTKASRGAEGRSPDYVDASTSTKGLGRIVVASLSAPRDLTLALTKGFHNAPKIYGDEELRQPPVIVGLKSGMMAAGNGLVTGLYDGLSGFVMQPVTGAKETGVSGFAKGMGKGIGGLICKPCAGACGVPGYALEGIHVELRKSLNRYLLKGEQQKDARIQ